MLYPACHAAGSCVLHLVLCIGFQRPHAASTSRIARLKEGRWRFGKKGLDLFLWSVVFFTWALGKLLPYARLGLLVELLNSSCSFFHIDDYLIIDQAFLLHGDCFGMIIRQKILPDTVFSVTFQHPTCRSLQRKYCSNDSKKWNCQIPFHSEEKQTSVSPWFFPLSCTI